MCAYMGPSSQNMMIKACLVMSVAYFLIAASQVAGERRSLQAEAVFDITKYGAKGDGTSDDKAALIDAWNAACNAVGPSRVLVPAGKTFMMGVVELMGPCKAAKPATPLILDIQGTINADPNPDIYTNRMWILIDTVDGIKVTGGGTGTLNARGQNAWKKATEDSHQAVSLTLQSCSNGELSKFNLVDAMGFHCKIIDSTNVKVSELKITAPEDSPNTDGIHLSNAQHIDIIKTEIGTGDDCISIGTGSTNIKVTGVKCGPGHGLAVGSLGKRPDEKSVGTISFTDCTLTKTTNGCRIKTYHASPTMTATDITFQQITMVDVKNPILIDQHYFSEQNPTQSNVKIKGVHFINIKGTTISEVPVVFNCSKTNPCEGIEMADIDLKPAASVTVPLTSICASATAMKIGGAVNPAPPATCA